MFFPQSKLCFCVGRCVQYYTDAGGIYTDAAQMDVRDKVLLISMQK